MSITVQPRTLAGVPLLLAMPYDAAAQLPGVLWFHGFGVDKETHRKELRQLARPAFWRWGWMPPATASAASPTWTHARPRHARRRCGR